MRKVIFIICLLNLSICSFALEYWKYRLIGSGGKYVNEIMSEIPYLSKQHASLSKQYVTDGNLDMSVSVQIGWYNFYRKISNTNWADWNVTGFYYGRKVYYAVSGSEYYTEIQELRATDMYFDVSAVSQQVTAKILSCSSIYNETNFTETLHLNVNGLTAGNEYKLKVEYVFYPVPTSEHDNFIYDSDETYKYIKNQNVIVDKTATGSNLLFGIPKEVVGSIINVNGSFNPYYNTGAGERYLVYDAPDAIISVSADTVNLPCTTSKVVGTSLVTKYGYGSFLASVGTYSSPTYVETVKTNTGCGVIYYGCSRTCNSVTSKSLEFLADNQLHLSFLKKKNYDTTSSCYKRYTNIMTRSLDSDLTLYDENCVEEFNQNCGGNLRMSRVYHLRDFSNVVSVSKEKYNAGSTLKLQHSAIYSNSLNVIKYPKLKAFFALGYTYYGPTEDLDIAQGTGVVSNVIDFEVVSKVVFPRLTLQEKAECLTCISDYLKLGDGVIHLKGKQISCGVYSPSLYMPEYMWEVSFDGQKWETITQSAFSNYIIDRHNLDQAVTMDSEKDLLLKSTILQNKQKVKFRQKVVLKSFASNEISSLYDYDGRDGKYYISVKAFDSYTYVPVPVLNNDNFAFSPLSFPEEQRLCKGDELKDKKISFRLRSSGIVSSEQINMMSDIVDYKIYEITEGKPSKLVSNSASYNINWNGETVGYRCVISWCRDSIFKDVWVIANPEERMDVENVNTSAVVCSREKENKRIVVLCPKGSKQTISVSNETDNDYKYSYRGMVTFMEPDTMTTDFSSMSRTKINSTIKERGWNYEAEAGVPASSANLDELRAWCRAKEHSENIKIITDAKAENERRNMWHDFQYSNSIEIFPSDLEAKSDTFFIKKRNLETGCESDSIRIDVTYFNGIENNVISFSAAADASKNLTYIVRDTDSPAIKGMEISGGYGSPATGNDNIYEYKYLYRESNGIWQPVGSDAISLKKGVLKIDRKTDICRVAMSRNGSDISTQVSDTSNILTIDVIEPLLIDDVVVSGDGMCAGTIISIGVPDFNSSTEVKKRNRYVWKVSDKRLTLKKSGEMDEYCDIYNSSENFDVTVYREDTLLKIKTPSLVIPIKVSTVKPYFSVVTNGNTEERILDYPDETFVYQAGTRFELKNSSEGADSYVWNLELQYYTGQEVEGLKSYLEQPVCYLYNQGQNKVRLTARNSSGCESSVTAENLYIQVSSLRNAVEMSYFANPETGDFERSEGASSFTIYPTITAGEPVKVYYSGGKFTYTLYNSIGQIITESVADSYVEIPMSKNSAGLYQLFVWPSDEGKYTTQIFKILRK